MATIINLKDVICRHNITINTGYYGKAIHVIVFFDPRDKETYIWKCTSGASIWEEGETYSITANYEGNQQLSRVKQIDYDHGIPDGDHGKKSEQEEIKKKNALDILLPDINLTNDEKYDMITTKKGVM